MKQKRNWTQLILILCLLLAGILLAPSGKALAYNLELSTDMTQIHDGTEGESYWGAIYLKNGEGNYTFSFESGQVPPGLQLQYSGEARCFLSGTPQGAGSFTFTVKAEDSAGNVGYFTFTIRISQGGITYTLHIKNGCAKDQYGNIKNQFYAGEYVSLDYHGYEPQWGCQFRGWNSGGLITSSWYTDSFYMPAETVSIEADFSHKLTTHVPFSYATCTEQGCKGYFVCQDCGNWFWDTNGEYAITDHSEVYTPAGGHNLDHIQGVKPTCEAAGIVEHYECLECGSWFWDAAASKPLTEPQETYLAPLGHSWGEWKRVKEPTTTTKGLEERVCQHDASHKESKEIPVLTPPPTTVPPTTPAPTTVPPTTPAPTTVPPTTPAPTTVPPTTPAPTTVPLTTTGPDSSTTAPEGTTSLIDETTTAEGETTSGEGESTTAEGETTTEEEQTTSAAEISTDLPTTNQAPESTAPAPTEPPATSAGNGESIGSKILSILPWVLMIPMLLVIGILTGILIGKSKKS